MSIASGPGCMMPFWSGPCRSLHASPSSLALQNRKSPYELRIFKKEDYVAWHPSPWVIGGSLAAFIAAALVTIAIRRMFPDNCACCGADLGKAGAYFVNLHGQKICHQCNSDLPTCRSCKRVTRKEVGTVASCDQCSKDSVITQKAAAELEKQVEVVLSKNLGLTLPKFDVETHLVGNGKLKDYARGTAHYRKPLAVTKFRSSWKSLVKEDTHGIIFVLGGLERIKFQTVVVHEVGHVYIKAKKLKLPPELEEGVCDLLVYMYLGHLAAEEETKKTAKLYLKLMEYNLDPRLNLVLNLWTKHNGQLSLDQFFQNLQSVAEAYKAEAAQVNTPTPMDNYKRKNVKQG